LAFLGFSSDSLLAVDVGADTTGIDTAITERLAAFANKDFATADRIRAELAEQGIALMDSKDPQTGERRTKWEIKR
jgi:cysteinyl-tRNA synthetase